MQFISSLLQQASVQASRSTALNPLGWALAISASSVLTAAGTHAPVWLTIILAVAFSLFALVYLVAYVYFMLHRPDMLRSERFNLSKLALERSSSGDDIRGIVAASADLADPPPQTFKLEEGK